jgi:hypothetical protein
MVREAISEVSCRIRCHIAAGNIAVAQLDETGAQTVIAARGFHTAADEITETLIFQARNAMLFRCAPGTTTVPAHRVLVLKPIQRRFPKSPRRPCEREPQNGGAD